MSNRPPTTPAQRASDTRPLSADDPVQFLPGVGPRRAAVFEKLGVRTVADLLEYFPIRHERVEARTIEDLELGQVATIVGRITRVRQGGRRGATIAGVLDNTGRCSATWFNAPYIVDKLAPGAVVRLTGRVGEFGGEPQLVNPRLERLDDDAEPVSSGGDVRLEPVYQATAELNSTAIARIIARSLDRMLATVVDPLPRRLIVLRGLAPRRLALTRMHRPEREAEQADARRRLAYDELLAMQLVVLSLRRRRRAGVARPLPATPRIDERIRRRLPFRLTPGQDAAVRDIVRDLARSRPMHRLLQGDVGSGKTLVAIYAALTAIANGAQVAIMAPTELLAEQLHRNAERYLEGSRVRRGLLTGSVGAARRRAMHASIRGGELDLVVGTQALIQREVEFARLGLVIIDEQHRFGVRQRMTIRCKGPSPHYLVMTATPIPRTLAMTVFGDLDVTTIRGLPPGRAPVRTSIVPPDRIDDAWARVRERVAAGEQAYVVYPLVEESDRVELRAATVEHRRLADKVFPGIPVGLVHGRMRRDEKERVMADFAAGRTPILVATTVIEVGIDVPAATVMVVEHANRYGLSQLHQLRGRVGRGHRPGWCILIPDRAALADAERLQVLTRTADGFKIAESDLRLRGPGELIGTRQHGLPELRVADLIGDTRLLEDARRDAESILEADPALSAPEHQPLRAWLRRRFRDRLELAATG